MQGGHDPRDAGGIYFVDVFERRASMLESLFPSIRSGSTLVPAKLIVPPGVSDAAVRQADLRQMTISQHVAAAVALRRLGYHVVAKPDGVIVSVVQLGSDASRQAPAHGRDRLRERQADADGREAADGRSRAAHVGRRGDARRPPRRRAGSP